MSNLLHPVVRRGIFDRAALSQRNRNENGLDRLQATKIASGIANHNSLTGQEFLRETFRGVEFLMKNPL
jgi:hypothetical protein